MIASLNSIVVAGLIVSSVIGCSTASAPPAGTVWSVRDTRAHRVIRNELEQLTESLEALDLSSSPVVAHTDQSSGGSLGVGSLFTLHQPTGARFPILEGVDGGRLNISEFLPSTSRAEVRGIRSFVSSRRLKRVLLLLSHEDGIDGGWEFEWQPHSTARSLRTLGTVHDAVYQPDGSILVSQLVGGQPRTLSWFPSDPDAVPQPLSTEIASDEFLQLQVSSPQIVLVHRWGAASRRLSLGSNNSLIALTPVSSDTPTTPVQFSGCTQIPPAVLAKYGLDCSSLTVPSDGDSVPITTVRRKALHEEQHAHAVAGVMISSYGAYGRNLPVHLSSFELLLLRRNFVLIFAHIRGGGEKGRMWHTAGRGANRQQSVRDIRAVVRWSTDSWSHAPIVLSSFSGGSIAALNTAFAERSKISRVLLISPLLDIPSTLARFPDDLPEWEHTPFELSSVFQTEFASQLPPTLLICGKHDPLTPLSGCAELLRAAGTNGPVSIMVEQRSSHDRLATYGEQLEREVLMLADILDSSRTP